MILVIPKEEKEIDPPELMDYLQPRMPYFMIPRFIRFVDSFPETGTQRTQKNKLREQGVTKDTRDMVEAGYKLKRYEGEVLIENETSPVLS